MVGIVGRAAAVSKHCAPAAAAVGVVDASAVSRGKSFVPIRRPRVIDLRLVLAHLAASKECNSNYRIVTVLWPLAAPCDGTM